MIRKGYVIALIVTVVFSASLMVANFLLTTKADDRSDTVRDINFVDTHFDEMKALKSSEQSHIPYFFEVYSRITQEYQSYLKGEQNIESFLTKMKAISIPFQKKFSETENVRLSYRHKLNKEQLKSPAINNLYHLGYQPRNRLKHFLEKTIEMKRRSKVEIQKIYTTEMINGFEKEWPELLDYLQIDKSKYRINLNKEKSNISVNMVETKLLKTKIAADLVSQQWFIQNVQVIPKENNSFFAVVSIEVEKGDEGELVNLSKNLYKKLFSSYNQIDYLSINLESKDGGILMTGLGRSFGSSKLDLKTVAELYRYTKNNN